uniref:Uncharacterized protein n=1 Tax=Arthrobotrys musiformis TaxID=47236 RepID=A0A482EB75_9PEZI|nr:hypothetical protein [Arthrobotrys musiformis]QBM31530.1 hypothetical protein [Arthrobotrys musiformis]QBM31680.1 hypothetical protein [Arthrobotrys musiformis]
MNKNLNNKLKYKWFSLSYHHLIKLLTHKDIKQNIINKTLKSKDIIELINEYYTINNLKKPNISYQSISNIKNRKLKLKSIERNEYTEDFVLFIKNKYNDFNVDLFFSITENNLVNKENNILNKTSLINKIRLWHTVNKIDYIYNYWLIIGFIGLILLWINEDLSKEYLYFNNIKDIEPTIIEEFPYDHVDISKESTSISTKTTLQSNKNIIIAFIISIASAFGLGAYIGIFIINPNIINEAIIIEHPGSVSPGTLNAIGGLFISYARNENAILDSID